MVGRSLHGLWREERGAQSLEFVALLPMVLLALLLMLQMALVGYAVVVAESATREAALTAARDQSLIAAWQSGAGASPIDLTAKQVAAGMPVRVMAVQCHSGRVTITLEASVPNVLFDSALAIQRSVTMPTQEGGCA
jgi:Flp pilus assembly protein TadG